MKQRRMHIQRGRYTGKVLTLAGLFFAFQVSGCLNGSTLPAGAQLALVLGTLGGSPFLLCRGWEFIAIKMKRA